MILLNGVFLSIASIMIGLILPGSLLLMMFKRGTSWTIADAFFTGWIWVVFCSAVLLPFSETTMSLVAQVRVLTAVMAVLICLCLLVAGAIRFRSRSPVDKKKLQPGAPFDCRGCSGS